jgi:hypothetical protein
MKIGNEIRREMIHAQKSIRLKSKDERPRNMQMQKKKW